MGLGATDILAVLDALSPEPEWETDLALVSSYSVDLVAAAALVIALAGEGRDHEDMRHAPLARACERMRGRFRVICQAGRVGVPKERSQTALVLADRWFREVDRDGNHDSWHAKLALVRYRRIERPADVGWRLWVGSRNLTQDTSWDSALLAVGRPGAGDRASHGIAHAGKVLANHAALDGVNPDAFERELRQVVWSWPDDVISVESFTLWTGQSDSALPQAPAKTRRLVAISPFADGATLAALGRLGHQGTTRCLLTSRATLDAVAGQRQAPLAGFDELYALDAAAPEDGDRDGEAPDDEQYSEVHRGLHAKLLLFQTDRSDTLWLGSANLTARAWGGGNAEVMAQLRVRPEVGNALVEDFIKSVAEAVPPSTLAAVPPEEDSVERALDAIRNRIAASWHGQLVLDDSTVRCQAAKAPIGASEPFTLRIALLGSGAPVEWPPGSRTVNLTRPPLQLLTELVVLELRSKEVADSAVRWVARAPLDPPPDVSRDRAVLSRLMGPRAFLAWLRTLIQEISGDHGDARWPPVDGPGNRSVQGRAAGIELHAPSLEAVLRAWARDRPAVVRIDRAVLLWAAEIRTAYAASEEPAERQALEELEAFERSWSVLRAGLQLDGEGRR